ncbi:MAG: hypothetical protein IJY87_05150 [Bacilli bacterium]|nr:hypothetical protein [Bacilli bacterium]
MIQLDEKRVVTKGNIPINDKLLNKYNSAEEIYETKNKIEYNSWNYYVEGLIMLSE